jgi:hypothetical protein
MKEKEIEKMLRYTAAAAIALMVGATAVTSADVERVNDVELSEQGASSRDVMPVAGGGIELHACRGVTEDGPYTIVEFGRSAPGDVSGVMLAVDAVPAGACAHLVVFTQPEPTQAL